MIQFKDFDIAEHLKTPEDMAEYLEASFEEDSGDGLLIRSALNNIARAQGMTQIARDAGLGRESLYKALSATGNPSRHRYLIALRHQTTCPVFTYPRRSG